MKALRARWCEWDGLLERPVKTTVVKFYGVFLLVLVAGTMMTPSALLASMKTRFGRAARTAAVESARGGVDASGLEERGDGDFPLTFVANGGKAREKFATKDAEHSLSLTAEGGVVLVLNAQSEGGKTRKKSGEGVRVALEDSNPAPKVVGLDELPMKTREVAGKRARRTARYAKAQFQQVYPGIDVVYRGSQGRLEYDFAIAPHANPNKIRLAFRGVDGLGLDDHGNLVLRAEEHSIRQSTPTVYQVIEGKRRDVASGYVLLGDNEVGFELGAYNKEYPLMIDPVLVYADRFGETEAALRME